MSGMILRDRFDLFAVAVFVGSSAFAILCDRFGWL